MAIEILMPSLSPTMESGTLRKWLVDAGQSVSSGDVIAEIETDKAVMEFESPEDGIIADLIVAEGAEGIAINTPIARLTTDDGESAMAKPDGDVVRDDRKEVPQSAEQPARMDEAEVVPAGGARATRPVNQASSADGHPDAEAAPQGDTRTMTVREALRDAMAEEMRRDDSVFLMGEEVAEYQGAYKVSQGLLDEFGAERVVDTPITEHGFTGLGVGAAFAGLRPIVEFMTFNFAMQAIDQIVNSAAKTLYMSGGKMTCPIVFRGPNGAAARVAAQHSQDFAAWYAHVPGLKVVQPFCAADAKGLLKSAIRDSNPVVFLENEILYGQSFEVPLNADVTVPIGQARIRRSGKDLTIATFGIGVSHALAAAELLEQEGIDTEIVDLRSLRPLDSGTVIESVRKTNRCITVEEGWPVGSIGSYLASVIMRDAFDWLDAPVLSITGKDTPMPYAANLERLALVETKDIIEAAHAVTYR